MSTIIFIFALWFWYVLVMQDGRRGSMRIVLVLPIVLPIGMALLLVEHVASKLRKAVTSACAFIMSISITEGGDHGAY